jgi:hypothetical protein
VAPRRAQKRAKTSGRDPLLVQLFGTNAEPDAGLALDKLSRVTAQNGLELVVRALLEPRQWVERRHRGHRSCPPL